jgi:ribonuclease P protein component
LKTDEISSVFDFRRQSNGEYFRFLVKPNQLSVPRVAVVVSKKVVHRAVERNYCKRVARELFRIRQGKLSGLDLVIQIKKRYVASDFSRVMHDFDLLISLSAQHTGDQKQT